MKTAILISGHMRSFDKCLPSNAWQVFRHFDNLSFYVSTIKDNNSYKAALLRDRLPQAKVEIEVVDEQPILHDNAGWNPRYFYGHEPYTISVPPQAIMAQLWQLEQVYRLYLKTTDESELADVIVRIRPDIYFHSFEFNGGFNEPHCCHVPMFGTFGGINDRFAIMDKESAMTYFYTFSRIADLMAKGCPLHPESLMKASLEFGGVKIYQNLLCDFSTLRETGELRRPEYLVHELMRAAAHGGRTQL